MKSVFLMVSLYRPKYYVKQRQPPLKDTLITQGSRNVKADFHRTQIVPGQENALSQMIL